MKIGTPEGKSPLNPLPGGERPTSGATKAEQKATEVDTSAKVELSGLASNLLADAGAAPEFDAAKVARIAQAIADKLIANAEELLGRPVR